MLKIKLKSNSESPQNTYPFAAEHDRAQLFGLFVEFRAYDFSFKKRARKVAFRVDSLCSSRGQEV
jgi:hypothetical protein